LPRSARIASRRPAPWRLREGRAVYASLPGPVYCDTSALLKLYLPEPGSDELNRTLEGRDDVLVSDLAVTEIVSALARRLHQSSLAPETTRRLHRAILARLDDGAYRRVDVTREVHRAAEHLLLTLVHTPLRAADALHLALALSASAGAVATFDVRLAAAARAVSLTVHPS
jgi:predicted nucleic acid-binding protein